MCNSIYPPGFITAVAVFQKPNAIPLCFSIDLFLNFLLSWLLVLLPSMFFLDVWCAVNFWNVLTTVHCRLLRAVYSALLGRMFVTYERLRLSGTRILQVHSLKSHITLFHCIWLYSDSKWNKFVVVGCGQEDRVWWSGWEHLGASSYGQNSAVSSL